MHLTECYEYVNGKMKNGAAGNSHEGRAVQSHCLASPNQAENCSMQQAAFQSCTTQGGGEKGLKVQLSFSLISDCRSEATSRQNAAQPAAQWVHRV